MALLVGDDRRKQAVIIGAGTVIAALVAFSPFRISIEPTYTPTLLSQEKPAPTQPAAPPTNTPTLPATHTPTATPAPSTSTAPPLNKTQMPAVPTDTPSINPAQATQLATCRWLKDNFPQSLEEVKAKFNLPESSTNTFYLIYEVCPGVANGFIIRDAVTEFHLEVPPGGCIDSRSGDTRYEDDVGTPVPDGFGGWRVYKGIVYTEGVTYRVANCMLP